MGSMTISKTRTHHGIVASVIMATTLLSAVGGVAGEMNYGRVIDEPDTDWGAESR